LARRGIAVRKEPMDSTPFESIESTQEFVELLLDAIREAGEEVQKDMEDAEERRREALLLVSHKLEKLSQHVSSSRRILNDLRTLRRLLLDERIVKMEKAKAGV
jgi:F0F1-type ATP synthase membrane subunit b/b'